MAPYSSKTLLPDRFTGSNGFGSFPTHCELLSKVLIWERKESINSAKTKLMNNRFILSES